MIPVIIIIVKIPVVVLTFGDSSSSTYSYVHPNLSLFHGGIAAIAAWYVYYYY